jgi:hypothetical protein
LQCGNLAVKVTPVGLQLAKSLAQRRRDVDGHGGLLGQMEVDIPL